MPSENVATSEHPDRRTRKREARRDALLELAADLVARDGVDALTMTALAEAADYAPASLYTYFPSRSELVASLQRRALTRLGRVAIDHVAAWDAALDLFDATAQERALAQLWGFSELFLRAPERHPRDFRLQQQLLVTPGAEDSQDAASVVPAAMSVLDVPRRLLDAAVAAGALDPGEPSTDPVGQPLEPALVRTFAWVVAMNGALLVDSLTTGLPSTGRALGQELTASLLLGWGATAGELDTARAFAHDLPQLDLDPTGDDR